MSRPTSAVPLVARSAQGQFLPGSSGNPAGRPPRPPLSPPPWLEPLRADIERAAAAVIRRTVQRAEDGRLHFASRQDDELVLFLALQLGSGQDHRSSATCDLVEPVAALPLAVACGEVIKAAASGALSGGDREALLSALTMEVN